MIQKQKPTLEDIAFEIAIRKKALVTTYTLELLDLRRYYTEKYIIECYEKNYKIGEK